MKRYYGSLDGLLHSVDPGPNNVSVPQTLNRYVYATNDPVNYTDKTGSSIRPLGPDRFAPFEDLPCIDIGNGFRLNVDCLAFDGFPVIPRIIAPERRPQPCDPGFFTQGLTDQSGRTFTADDLNQAARVVFAESAVGASHRGNVMPSVQFSTIGLVPGFRGVTKALSKELWRPEHSLQP
jgi:hypothetical protein